MRTYRLNAINKEQKRNIVPTSSTGRVARVLYLSNAFRDFDREMVRDLHISILPDRGIGKSDPRPVVKEPFPTAWQLKSAQ